MNESKYSKRVLTPRETKVLQLISEGFTSKKISDHLNINVWTVKTHRNNMMNKLKIHNIAGLTKYALREGLASLVS